MELEGNMLHLIPLAEPQSLIGLASKTGLYCDKDRDSVILYSLHNAVHPVFKL